MPSRTAVNNLLNQALAHAAAGNESAAIPVYRRAISRGLSRKNLHTALIGLSSSLRETGNPNAAIRTLQKAHNHFPRDTAIILFLALCHYDAGQTSLALRQLADALLKESRQSTLAPYKRALRRKYHAARG